MEANNKIYDFIIVGGGIYSCCVYYYLKKHNPETQILIIEKDNKLGGCIKTERCNNNVIYELGANVFKLCNNSYKLIKELNLTDQIAIVNKGLVRYISYENNIYPLYLSFLGYICFPLISLKNKIKLIYKILFKKYKHVNSYHYDISIKNYMKENFDSEHYQFLLLPLIYGSSGGHGDMSALSFLSRNLKLVHNIKNSLRIWNDKINEIDDNTNKYTFMDFNKNNLSNIKKYYQSSCAETEYDDSIILNNPDLNEHEHFQNRKSTYIPENTETNITNLNADIIEFIPTSTYTPTQTVYKRLNQNIDKENKIQSFENEELNESNKLKMNYKKNGEYIEIANYNTQSAFRDICSNINRNKNGKQIQNKQNFIFYIFNYSLKFIKNIYFSINYTLFKYFPMIYNNIDNNFLQRIEEEEKKKYIGKTVSLNCGLYEFICQLKKYIHEKDISTNTELNFIEKNIKNNIWRCNIKKNNTETNICSKNVILTVNSKMCANILRKILPIEIKNNLEKISYSSLITANIYFNKEDIKIPKNLFGLLSADKNAYILGCFYASNMFTNRCENNKSLLTLYIRDNNITFNNNEELNKTILNNLKKIFPFSDNAKPTILNVTKWKHILPAYSENYENKLKEFLNELTNSQYENLFVDAGWITGTSISDRITSAMELSDYIIKKNII
ncbi:protoporphyrinogen oxidase, putative [Plasmodium berghei]|uniref:Protoporphyrinogen oxidase, putative n=2 Tax=Plasmodium berghei TaxID=5821 RepID=A0A509AE71_PLABA|nr:protoporphyrinogen oxidase, putative [Plasmodium berghei ANKA]CXI10010.1 protoporphyrinogen oxidase, putative [Plasmodium berghei]SCL92945.1 protoporphyrinogen oxidase, putative [Plasmodium berghei]SCM15757.1 protoporphyrinogen oxidase, putative [Plasmodium berghei]SCM17552.1 protoporphyrinogen oxidase, putative [Plasmodium berghei]SCN22989.1 protoporphyrinogen oxidase, putative [Plasmodium berghei]|eukprot:XP_034420363.1 protoporphyrinogen oxidase, putative [Plasmodium berghei ANKA]